MPSPVVSRRVLGGVGWTPTRIADCVLWLEADYIRDVADGGSISTWYDLSGLGNHAIAGTAPVVKDAIVNGRRVVRFAAASSQYLKSNGVATLLSGSDKAFTVVAVVVPVSTSVAYSLASLGSSSDANPYHWLRLLGDTTLSTQRRDDAATTKNSNAQGTYSTSAQVLAWVFTGTGGQCGVNGSFNASADMDVGALTVNQFGIGALYRTTVATFLNGDIAFLGVWTRALSAGELSALNALWLNPRYALAAT